MAQQKPARHVALLSGPVQTAERQRYQKKWDLLKEKSAKEYSNASVDGMTVYRKYSPGKMAPVEEIGVVKWLIKLIPPNKLMEANKRVSWEDMDRAVLLADGAQGDPACIAIFRDDGLFVIAKTK